MDYSTILQLNEVYRYGVYNEETLSEDELLSIQEWVEALIEEGYNLDQYTDEELCEAYLEDLQEARGEGPQAATPGTQLFQKLFRGVKKEKGSKGTRMDIAAFQGKGSAANRRINNEEFDLYEYTDEDLYERIAHDGSFHRDPSETNLPPKPELPDHMKYGRNDRIPYTQRERIEANKTQEQKEKEMEQRQKLAKTLLRQPQKEQELQKEQVDIYDIILSHLLDEGYTETPEAAEVIMANMSKEWRDEIIEATVMSVTWI